MQVFGSQQESAVVMQLIPCHCGSWGEQTQALTLVCVHVLLQFCAHSLKDIKSSTILYHCGRIESDLLSWQRLLRLNSKVQAWVYRLLCRVIIHLTLGVLYHYKYITRIVKLLYKDWPQRYKIWKYQGSYPGKSLWPKWQILLLY